MLNYIVGACAALAIVLAIVSLVLIVKIQKAKKTKKTAYKFTIEQEIIAIKDAVRGLANNNGQGNAHYITNLNKFDNDDETLDQLKVNRMSFSQKVSDRKAKKLSKVKV